jgi:hypothetical protein
MLHDGSHTLGEICGSEEVLLSNIIEIQNRYMISRVSDCHWAQNLRFLRIPEIGSEQSCRFCSAIGNDATVLYLTEKHEQPGITNYVCVSYCWNSERRLHNAATRSYHISSAEGCRTNRAPTNILRRAIRYAITQNVPFVWIDQECIEQSDILEQELGIYSMDIVYRRSNHPLAIIDMAIESQQELDFYAALLDYRESNRRCLMLHVQEVLEMGESVAKVAFFTKLVSDPLWSRAWIFQEQRLTKERMVFLIEHHPELARRSTIGQLQNEVVIPFVNLLSWPVGIVVAVEKLNMYGRPEAKELIAQLKSTLLVSHYEAKLDELWNKMDRRHVANTWSQLEKRDISVVSDRLAILANLCKYRRRLNNIALGVATHNISICVLALAILNGDLNPFPEQEGSSLNRSPRIGESKRSFWYGRAKPLLSMKIEEVLFHWIVPDHLLRHSFGRIPRLPEVEVKRSGLETNGWLWIVEKCIKFDGLRERHSALESCINDSLQNYGSTKVKALFYLFFNDLLADLKRRNLPKVVDALLYTLGCCQRDHSATTDTNWARNEATGEPCDIWLRPPAQIRPFISSNPHYFALIENHLMESHWLVSFIRNMLTKEKIWCARLHGQDTPMAIFDCTSPTAIFTTVDTNLDILRDASAPIGLLNIISVEVVKVQVHSSASTCQQLQYKGRWRDGFWYASMGTRRRYGFPWTAV